MDMTVSLSGGGITFAPAAKDHWHVCRLKYQDGKIISICEGCGRVFSQDETEDVLNWALSEESR